MALDRTGSGVSASPSLTMRTPLFVDDTSEDSPVELESVPTEDDVGSSGTDGVVLGLVTSSVPDTGTSSSAR